MLNIDSGKTSIFSICEYAYTNDINNKYVEIKDPGWIEILI